MRARAGFLSILVAALGCNDPKALLTSASGGRPSTSGGTGVGPGSSSTGGGTGGTSSSSGTTTGTGGPCGWGLTWHGDVCAADDCGLARVRSTCAFGDGGYGTCIGSSCEDRHSLSDVNNCGYPGMTCPTGYICRGGTCFTTSGPGPEVLCNLVTCPMGMRCMDYHGCLPVSCTGSNACPLFIPFDGYVIGQCCGLSCVDYNWDLNNCGNCGLVCPQGNLCVGGRCIPARDCATANGGSCMTPVGHVGTCCLGACVNPLTDNRNCGACSVACAAGNTCSGGVCMGTGQSCAAGMVPNGDGTCYPASCQAGSNGTTCRANEGNLCCAGGCIDLWSDPENCGNCAHACPQGTPCVNGLCPTVVDCATGNGPAASSCLLDGGSALGQCCNGSCIDMSSDDQNCSACGAACPVGSHCSQSSCSSDAGPLCCGGGTCFDPSLDKNDPLNCDGCGAVCASGICVSPYGCLHPAPHDNCLTGCPPFTACTYRICVDSQCSGNTNSNCLAEDGTIGWCCFPFPRACAHLVDDPQNCGECGIVCPTGQTCAGGKCG